MRTLTLTEAMNEAVREEMQRDDSVYVVGLGLSSDSTGTAAGLVDDFGATRVRSAPNCETAIVGSAVGYLSEIFRYAIRGYTLGVRYLYAVFPIAFWLFDDRLFVAVTAALGIKFIFIEDFAYIWKRRKRPSDDGTGSILQRHGF